MPPQHNKRLIDSFIRYSVTQGVSPERLISLRNNLKWYLPYAKKPFSKMGREDINRLVYHLEKTKYTEWTKYLRKAVLMQFIRFLTDEEHPPQLKDIHLKQPRDVLNKGDLLTYDELLKVIEAAPPNYAALYAATYDGNFRKGEVLGHKHPIRIKDLRILDNYGELSYKDSKMQAGCKILTISMPYLLSWLNIHPRKDDPNAPLWMTYDCARHRWTTISKQTFLMNIKYHSQQAGLNKRVYCHLLRHSRTTEMHQKNINTSIIEKSGGWVKGSQAMRRYEHLSNEDYKREMLVNAGIVKPPNTAELKVQQCAYCKHINPPKIKLCRLCLRPLDLKDAAKEEKERMKAWDGLVEEVRELQELVELIKNKR